MAKRPPSPALIPNPLIKKRNLEWTLDSSPHHDAEPPDPPPPGTTTAAIESGEAIVTDHLARFTKTLSSHIIEPPSPVARLPISSYAALYESCAGSPHGAHFVIHQHDHPVAGTHYDLRLQINESSSASWAVMYGPPGDPNSLRLNRNATETRIHSLWNHLVETASPATGSLLIWDTGTYTVLPRRSKHAPRPDPSSPAASPRASSSSPEPAPTSQQSLLHAAFQDRKIRLRLPGTRLPDPYVLNLRLTRTEDASGRAKATRHPRRRRRGRRRPAPQPETSSDSEPSSGNDDGEHHVAAPSADAAPGQQALSAAERELRELEDDHVRRTNAYPGAANSVGSVHQRKWYLSLDRPACGFAEVRRGGGRPAWEAVGGGSVPGEPGRDSSRREGGGREASEEADGGGARLSFPFHVRGAAHERSVVTGRRGADILRDEGVAGFVPRKGWTPILN